MRQRFKSLSKKSQVILMVALMLSLTIVAYAAISSLLTKSVTTNLTKGDVMEMDLSQPVVTGTVTPGDSIAVSPSITNTGTKDCLAFVKIDMPTYGSGSPAYSLTINDGWIKVSESSGVITFGYNDVLQSDESTGTLCDSLTMVEMSASEFKGLADVNVEVTGYLADTAEYGTDINSAWNKIAGGE